MTRTPHPTLLGIIDIQYDLIKQHTENVAINDNGCWNYQGSNCRNREHSHGKINNIIFRAQIIFQCAPIVIPFLRWR